MKVLCPQCKGRGTVFDAMSLMLTIGWPIAMMTDNPMTRKECPTCDGEGKLDLDEE